jgi:hypothetical protein
VQKEADKALLSARNADTDFQLHKLADKSLVLRASNGALVYLGKPTLPGMQGQQLPRLSRFKHVAGAKVYDSLFSRFREPDGAVAHYYYKQGALEAASSFTSVLPSCPTTLDHARLFNLPALPAPPKPWATKSWPAMCGVEDVSPIPEDEAKAMGALALQDTALMLTFNSRSPDEEEEECKEVTISPDTGGPHHDPVRVSMSTETSGAEIYYTMDGTDPSTNATEFSSTGTFVLDYTGGKGKEKGGDPETKTDGDGAAKDTNSSLAPYGTPIERGVKVVISAIAVKSGAEPSGISRRTLLLQEKWNLYRHSTVWAIRRRGVS